MSRWTVGASLVNVVPIGTVIYTHTFSLCRVELVVQFPARGSTQVLLCVFPGVLWLWHFLYSVAPHPVSSLQIYTSVVSRASMEGAASQAGDAESSRPPGLTSGLQGSVNVHRGALLLVPQWHCISSFVFNINHFSDSMTMLGQRWPMVVRARWPNIIKKALAQCNFAHRPYVRPTCWFYVGPSCWPNKRPTCRPYVGPTLPHGCTCTLAQHNKKGVGPM